MKPETILQSDLLDIIFFNRNHSYGAYQLRRNYSRRLLQSMGFTCLLVLVAVLSVALRPAESTPVPQSSDTVVLRIMELTPLPRPMQPEEASPATRNARQLANTTPIVKPDREVAQTTVEPADELDRHLIGDTDVPGDMGDPQIVAPPAGKPAGSGGADQQVAEMPITQPLDVADVMPAFNGNLHHYMLRHLRQPDDLLPGDRIAVRVRFVVTSEGSIEQIEILQSGRADLDKEVLRVVRNMPRWKPGKQGGRNVPVYFNLPVIFVASYE